MSNIEGTVSISVRQLDDLRNQITKEQEKIKGLENQVKDLKGKEKKIKFELNLSKDTHIPALRLADYIDGYHGHSLVDENMHTTKMFYDVSLLELVKGLKNGDLSFQTPVYENCEDLESVFMRKAESAVSDKMEALHKDYVTGQQELRNLREKQHELVTSMSSNFDKKLEEQRRAFNKEKETLNNTILELQGAKLELGYQETIAKLEKEISELKLKKRRSWFG